MEARRRGWRNIYFESVRLVWNSPSQSRPEALASAGAGEGFAGEVWPLQARMYLVMPGGEGIPCEAWSVMPLQAKHGGEGAPNKAMRARALEKEGGRGYCFSRDQRARALLGKAWRARALLAKPEGQGRS